MILIDKLFGLWHYFLKPPEPRRNILRIEQPFASSYKHKQLLTVKQLVQVHQTDTLVLQALYVIVDHRLLV